MRSLAVLSMLAVLSLPPAASARSLEGGPEIQVNVSTMGEQRFAEVAIDAAGNAMVVWSSDHLAPQGLPRVYSRIYDASGAPRTGEFEVSDPAPSYSYTGKVVADAAGGFLAVWNDDRGISARRFGPDGQALGAVLRIAESGGALAVAARPQGGVLVAWSDLQGFRGLILNGGTPGPVRTLYPNPVGEPSAAVAPGGDVLVTWSQPDAGFFTDDIWGRLFDGDLNPRGTAFRVNEEAPYRAGYQQGPSGIFHANGSFSIVWMTAFTFNQGRLGVFGRTFVGAGQPQAGVVDLSEGDVPVDLHPPVLASDPFGRILLLWGGSTSEDELGVVGRFLSPSLQPLGETFLANRFKGEGQIEPAVAADAHGGFLAVWSSGSGYPPILPVGGEGLSSQDGNFFGVFGRRFAGCAPAADQLCLGSGRFRVEVAWTDHDGNSGTGTARALTDDTGTFSFFAESNLELMIKVLDGRGVNGHFWVFYGALSDVAYTVTVTDTITDIPRTYTNPSGRMASRADVQAFSDPGPPPPAAAEVAAAVLPLTPAILCGAGETELCLGDRFAVSVRFVDPRTGAPGQGQAIQLTADTGVFWFFEQGNLELMVKALDGRPVNNRYWIFYGALSDVEYTITVRDILTGETRTYRNLAGTMASRADTRAFPLQ